MWLGDGKNHGTGIWTGQIRNTMIFKKALQTDDIIALAQLTKPY